MGSSASFHRISVDNFKIIQQAHNGAKRGYLSLAEGGTTCRGSHWALEFILSSGQDNKTAELVSNIFNPKQAIGGQEFDNLPHDEQWEMYDNGDYIPFLDPTTIFKINNLVKNISEADVQRKYDAKELNNNGIYPKIWHNDNSSDYSFNERHILEDFVQLKETFKTADQENNFILVFVG